MAINTSGTATTDGTEQTLATIATVGTFLLVMDRNAMTATDAVILRSKTKVLTGGTTRLFQKKLVLGAAADIEGVEHVTVPLDPVPSGWETVFTLEHVGGTTGIAIPWEVHSV